MFPAKGREKLKNNSEKQMRFLISSAFKIETIIEESEN